MANCSKCGAFIDGNAKFCNICGQAVTAPTVNTAQNYSQPVNTQPTYNQPAYTQPVYQSQPNYNGGYSQGVPQSSITENNLPPEFKPISAWGYVGYNILFAIPIIGFIFLIVYACGGTQNKNLKNYARSFFCVMLISIILSIIFVILGLIFGINLSNYMQ